MALRKLDEIKRAVEGLSNEEKIELARFLSDRTQAPYPAKVVDLSEFYGCIQFPEDALAYQHRIRAEWER
jgi:hypothetical protein